MIGSIGLQGGFGELATSTGIGNVAIEGGFEERLSRWSARAQPGVMTEEDARGAAEELVAMTFVQPILKQMREMNEAAVPFSPGIAERRFGALWDAEIAQRLVKASGFGLVDAVARNVLSKARKGAPGASTEPANHAKSGTKNIDTIG